MAPPRAHGPPMCADGSPPRTALPCQSALACAGTTARGAGPASSALECSADPGQGWPGSVLAPHHSTPAPSLRAAAPAQTAGPLSGRPAPHAASEAGSSAPHRGQTVAGPGTPGLGTPERRAHVDQSRINQADETGDAAGPDAAVVASHLAVLRPAPSP